MTPLLRVKMGIKLTNASLRVITDLHSGGGYTNIFARIESVCTFKLGVNCLMYSGTSINLDLSNFYLTKSSI